MAMMTKQKKPQTRVRRTEHKTPTAVQTSKETTTEAGMSKMARPTPTRPDTVEDKTGNSNYASSNAKEGDKKKKKVARNLLKEDDVVEGVANYKVLSLLRCGNVNIDYRVRVDTESSSVSQDFILRTEPTDRCRLKFIANVLQRIQKSGTKGCKNVIEMVEFGYINKNKLNFMVLNAHGPSLDDVRKSVLQANFTLDCALNISLQALKAIQNIHVAGFVNRNVKPASLAAGLGEKENVVYIIDFRLTRLHINQTTHLAKPARPKVQFLGTARYASRACMQNLDQGRKDDLESWIYTMYNLVDDTNGIKWKRQTKEQTLQLKQRFFKHELDVYAIVPVQLKRLIDYIQQLAYETEPDYHYLMSFLQSTMTEWSVNPNKYDWVGKMPDKLTKEVPAERSPDNKLSGVDDFEPPKEMKAPKGKKKEKIDRKKMATGDVINNGVNSWKVLSLLGSGGFGDVYKVQNAQQKAGKAYALKTESTFGKKTMLRLKVEMSVLMAIAEARKKRKTFNHFVDFIDRGKSDEFKCKFVVMSLVGPSLEDIRKKYKVRISQRSTAFNIALQTLEAVHDLHELGFLHRDIKPANFAVGIGEHENVVFMLDFGICRSFVDPATRKHRAPRKKVKFLGTTRYASRACMRLIDQGRKDDLECWLYMVFDVMDEQYGVMWRKLPNRDDVLGAKQLFFECKLEKVYTNISTVLKVLVEYIDKLEFQAEPDYAYCNSVLKQAARDQSVPTSGTNWVGKLKHLPKQEDSDESSGGDLVSDSDENSDS